MSDPEALGGLKVVSGGHVVWHTRGWFNATLELLDGMTVLATLVPQKGLGHPWSATMGSHRWTFTETDRRTSEDPLAARAVDDEGVEVATFRLAMRKYRGPTKRGTFSLPDGTSYQWRKPKRWGRSMIMKTQEGEVVLTLAPTGRLIDKHQDQVIFGAAAVEVKALPLLVCFADYVFEMINGRNIRK